MALHPYDLFDVRSLLNEEERAVQESVARFTNERVLPIIGDAFDQARFPSELVPEIAALGLLGATLPAEYGGGDLGAVSYGLICQELERGDSGLRSFVSVQSSLCMYPIYAYGSEEQRQQWLPAMARGELIGCFGLTEAHGGSDPASMKTRAVRDGSDWRISGSKMWITSGPVADLAIVWAQTEDGIQGFVLEKGMAGFTTQEIKHKMSLRASLTGALFFDDVRVEKENLIGTLNRGWDVAKALLAHERTMIGAMGDTGVGRPLGQVAADHLGLDEAGRLDEPLLRARIADYDIDAAAFRLAMERAGDQMKAKQAHPAIASMLKYYGSELNKRRHELAMAAGGSDALEWEGDRSNDGQAAREWLRTKANSIEGGTSEVQLNIIAKHLLKLPGA